MSSDQPDSVKYKPLVELIVKRHNNLIRCPGCDQIPPAKRAFNLDCGGNKPPNGQSRRRFNCKRCERTWRVMETSQFGIAQLEKHPGLPCRGDGPPSLKRARDPAPTGATPTAKCTHLARCRLESSSSLVSRSGAVRRPQALLPSSDDHEYPVPW